MRRMQTTSDWCIRHTFDWTTTENQALLQALLQCHVPYIPAEFQTGNTARLLMGQDVLCISATGDGKSALMYMLYFVRPDTLVIIISPTNALEEDMVSLMQYSVAYAMLTRNIFPGEELGINALAINADATTRAECETPKANLWEKAALETCQVLLLSPEQLNTDNFQLFISNPDVRLRLALFSVDECHLVDEWGVGFRPAYQGIGFQRSWLPDWTAVLALTATLEPGRQTDAVARTLGFYEGRYHLDRRDCARRNIDIIIRPIQYTYTTQEFRDLDWLIPTTLEQPSDIEKTLIYFETIDLGHRLAHYLRTLLPTSLRSRSHCVIRHIHSIRCPACKIDDTSSLYQAGDSIRSTAIHIVTDVLGVGIDMPDFDRVICFVTPPSAASLIQRIGRTSRGRGRHGVAYVYVRKSDLENTELYIRSATSTAADVRLLNEPNTFEDFIQRLPSSKAQQGGKAAAHKLSKWKICPSLRLILASHALGNCIARQIDIIYQNPGLESDCGRCSSCRLYPIPEPRSKASTSTTAATYKSVLGQGESRC